MDIWRKTYFGTWKKMFRKKCLKYGIPRRKIYQHEILWIDDSSLCLGECMFLFVAIQPDSCCQSLSSPSFQDPPISQLSSPPIENSELYIYADFSVLSFSWLLKFAYCVYYKTFQGKTISGGDNYAWYLFSISEKIIPIDCKDILVEVKRTGFKI